MIKVEFSKRLLNNKHGPGISVSRLIQELNKDKYPVSIVNGSPDVFINAINHVQPPKGARTIFRVDGCYFDKDRVRLNKGIKQGIKHADGVIYQSHFAKKLNDHILNQKAKRFSIVYNGFEQSLISKITPRKHSGFLFVSSAKWRNSKRPQSIVNGFVRANIKNAQLIMIGEVERPLKGKNVFWIGQQSQKSVFSWYKTSDAMVHLCFIDSCPNSVVEGLSFGLPVLCNNIGGTPEIVKEDGIVLPSDEFNFKVVPKIVDAVDPEIVAKGLKNMVDRKWSVKRPDLDISITAKKYCRFIKEVFEL